MMLQFVEALAFQTYIKHYLIKYWGQLTEAWYFNQM